MAQLNRQHRDDRAVMFDADFGERLQPPQFQRTGIQADAARQSNIGHVRVNAIPPKIALVYHDEMPEPLNVTW